MANIDHNKGRRLRVTLSRFSAMLIEEAGDLSGMSHSELDVALDLPPGQAHRYSLYPLRSKTRAPQARGIQKLEERVAEFLKRSPNKIVIRKNVVSDDVYREEIIGIPDDSSSLNVRDADHNDLHLCYEDDWPTYRRLKYTLPINGIRLIDLYAWQWGVLWDRGVLQAPWTREALGIDSNAKVESFLPRIMQEFKLARQEQANHDRQVSGYALIHSLTQTAGILPEYPTQDE